MDNGSAADDAVSRMHSWNVPSYLNMGAEICDRYADDPERLALIYVDSDGVTTNFTFAQIRQYSNRLANALAHVGVAPGDRVAIILSQRPETAISHVACFKLGAISVALFTQFGPEALSFRLLDSGAKVVITDGDNVDKVLAIKDRLPELETIVVTQPVGRSPGPEFWNFLGQASDQFTPVRTRSSDPALIIYTSGSTGNAKGTLHGHRLVEAHRPAIAFTLDSFPQPNDRFWTPADWAWGGGLLDALFPSWYCGVPVVAHRFRKFDPERAFALIGEHQVRNAFMPATALKMMREVSDAKERWKPAMRSINSGGEALGETIIEWGKQVLGLAINEFWGQTEANFLTGNSSLILKAKAGSIGRPTPGHCVEVLGESGEILPAGKLGTLAAKGPDPIFFLGYWNNPKATEEKIKNGWLLTGDAGYKDEDGYFWYVGRDDDLIKSGAYRVGPTEIEECIMKHSAVAMVAVVGSPDAIRGNIIKAFVKLKADIEPSETLVASIQERVRSQLAAYQYPREVEFVSELPTTLNGKIRRRDLREMEQARKAKLAP